jgi:hypothetical protein
LIVASRHFLTVMPRTAFLNCDTECRYSKCRDAFVFAKILRLS